jgi:hypothetical protein
MTAERVEVVYIAGAGRSGSTLLAMLLGTIPGFEPVGELRHMWARGVQKDQLCGCGRAFHDCPFWSQVGQSAFGGWDHAPAERMIELQSHVDRLRHVPALSLLRLSPERRRLADEYAETMSRVYRAVGGMSGVRAVVDSSKSVTYALLLGRMPDVKPRLIHLVRDSRAVAHSWTRRRAMPEVQGEEQYMATFGPVRSAAVWAGNNAALDLVGTLGGPGGTKLRYESLVRGDMVELHRLAAAIGVEGDEIRNLAGPEVAVGVQHTVAGNPARFAQGHIALKPDEAWRRGMPARDRRTVALITWPLLARYGYPLRG